MNHYHLLCLGDSYTIGEAVPLHQSLPYQLVHYLRKKEYHFSAPEIIARTGWTTEQLDDAMKAYPFSSKYDFVTIMIGVNNQFQGQELILYKQQLEIIIKKAIELANGKKDHVVSISIPDYSITPFASALETDRIAKEIEVFNTVNKALSIQYKIQYADITPESRAGKNEPDLMASDGLHPSIAAYENWSKIVGDVILQVLK